MDDAMFLKTHSSIFMSHGDTTEGRSENKAREEGSYTQDWELWEVGC